MPAFYPRPATLEEVIDQTVGRVRYLFGIESETFEGHEGLYLTVVSPDGVDGAEVVLEPMAFAPAKAYQKALFEAGIPATAFISTDIDAEYRRLSGRGVKFRGEPQQMGPVKVALFEDGCGNLLNLAQPS